MAITQDTNRKLATGEGAYYNEREGEWYDSIEALIKDLKDSGMDDEDIEEARDIDEDGYIFYTTVE